MVSGRNEKIDMLRGIAVILVVWGHTIQYASKGIDYFSNSAFKFIYSFHMPLFMIICGYLYKYSVEKYTIKELLLKKSMRIAYPCVVWNLVIHLFSTGINWLQGDISFTKMIIGILPALKGMWFLWAVAICSFMFLFYKKLNGWIFIGLQLLLLFLVRYVPNSNEILYMYPYFCVGFLLNAGKIKNKKCLLAILAVAYPLMVMNYQTRHYIYETGIWFVNMEFDNLAQVGIDIYRWVVGFSGIAFMYILFEVLYSQECMKRIVSVLVKVGKMSLEIYLVQAFVFGQIFTRVLYHVDFELVEWCKNEWIYSCIISAVLSVIILVVVCYVIKIVKKNGIFTRLLFGK